MYLASQILYYWKSINKVDLSCITFVKEITFNSHNKYNGKHLRNITGGSYTDPIYQTLKRSEREKKREIYVSSLIVIGSHSYFKFLLLTLFSTKHGRTT